MFRVEFFCDDKKLAEALRGLMGLSHGQPSVLPVVNAVKNGNGLAAVTSGKAIDRFIAELSKHSGKQFKPVEIRAMIKSLGLSTGSSSYYLSEGKKRGALRSKGSTGSIIYTVT